MKSFDTLLKEVGNPFDIFAPPVKRIWIGYNALDGKKVYIYEDNRKVHEHIIGGSGTGKSKAGELHIREDIENGNGLCLIDPKGDLYNDILNFVAANGYGNKVIIIDPNDTEYSIGLNCLEYDELIRSSTSHASEVMKGTAKIFGGEELDGMPQLQRWERNAFLSLIEGGQTIVELGQFMRYAYVREIVLSSVSNTEVKEEWEVYNHLTKSTIEAYSGAIFNRANKFCVGQNVRRIFGQSKTTIDFRKAMDEGKIILCNLARQRISKEEQEMLGIVILDKITQAAHSRGNIRKENRRPFYVYMDEFQHFISRDIAEALWELRAFAVSFVLIHQELDQIDDPQVLSAVLNEPQVRIAFRTGRKNAEMLFPELFAGQIRADKVKDEIYTKSQFSKEITRKIRSHSTTRGHSHVEGITSNSTFGTTNTTPDDLAADDDDGYTAMSEIFGDGYISTDTENYSETDGETEVPFLEPYTIEQLISRQYYSLDEIREKFIAWIQRQPDRHAQVKIGVGKTIPVIIREVEETEALPFQIKKVIDRSNAQYALPACGVDRMLDQRKAGFLDQAVQMGYIEAKKETQELTPQNMRRKEGSQVNREKVVEL